MRDDWASVRKCLLTSRYGASMIDRDDLTELVSHDVLEVGVRQAWPFITFGAPTPERKEHRLFLDPEFSLVDADGTPIDGSALSRLEGLLRQVLVEVRLERRVARLRFDNRVVLAVSDLPAPQTEPPPDSRGYRP